jgi:hypothetical protein
VNTIVLNVRMQLFLSTSADRRHQDQQRSNSHKCLASFLTTLIVVEILSYIIFNMWMRILETESGADNACSSTAPQVPSYAAVCETGVRWDDACSEQIQHHFHMITYVSFATYCGSSPSLVSTLLASVASMRSVSRWCS